MQIKVGRLGAQTKEFSVEEDFTLEEVLSLAGIDSTRSDVVRINGKKVRDDFEDVTLKEGDLITVTGRKEGGK